MIASFIIDRDPVFAYMGWNLAHSLVLRGQMSWSDIHVQFTPEVDPRIVQMFRELGCAIHQLNRFGDGKYCNKLAQWENLREIETDYIVLLDTDMICVSAFFDFVPKDVIGAKVVDLPNPQIEVLDALFDICGFNDRPPFVTVDAKVESTYRANSNGGFYSIPKRVGELLFEFWRNYAELLISNPNLLLSVGKESHIDQIAFCMAIHRTGLPFTHIAANVNYYSHFSGDHLWRDESRELAILHFHNSSLNMIGLLEPPDGASEHEKAAIGDANTLISLFFNTQLFWEMRYDRFSARGSGVGSRGNNLIYKRELLKREGIEQAASVLDVGCGDLEVLRGLNVRHYVGIDKSEISLRTAAAARPDWTFLRAPAPGASSADLVLCFEVTIHQRTKEEYHDLIQFVTDRTIRRLIISGYDLLTNEILLNHMVFFHEPLLKSLEEVQRFRSIRKIGEHSTVSVYRCDV